MHLVGTNLTLWLHIVLKESLLEINHAEDLQDSSNSTHGVHDDGDNDFDDLPHCDGFDSDILGDGTLSLVNPFLFPFAIEFVLIGAIFFFHMFKKIQPAWVLKLCILCEKNMLKISTHLDIWLKGFLGKLRSSGKVGRNSVGMPVCIAWALEIAKEIFKPNAQVWISNTQI